MGGTVVEIPEKKSSWEGEEHQKISGVSLEVNPGKPLDGVLEEIPEELQKKKNSGKHPEKKP